MKRLCSQIIEDMVAYRHVKSIGVSILWCGSAGYTNNLAYTSCKSTSLELVRFQLSHYIEVLKQLYMGFVISIFHLVCSMRSLDTQVN